MVAREPCRNSISRNDTYSLNGTISVGPESNGINDNFSNMKGSAMKSGIKNKWDWACRIGVVFTILFMCVPVQLQAADDQVDGNKDSHAIETLKIIVGESMIIKTTSRSTRVAITDPAVADVQVLTPYEVLVQAVKAGSTDLIIWGEEDDEVRQWKIRTGLNTKGCEETLNALFPNSTLQVSESGDMLIIRGLLRSTDEAMQLRDYLDKSGFTYVDMTGIAGVQQVQLQVRVAEVSRQAIRALGINAFHTGNDFFGASRIGSLASIDIGPAKGTTAGSLGTSDFQFLSDVMPSSLVTILAGFPGANLELFIQAIADNQYMRLLANPTLVALSGEEASFLAGGEYPIPVVQSSSGGSAGSSVTIQYREYGIRLKFRPIVLGDNTIRLSIAPEVSELTDVGAVVIEGFSVPALLTRKMETTLELKSGQTFAMAGLIRNQSETIRSKVPGLGDLPVLGALFRSIRYRQQETELVVLVTAELVEPMSVAKMPPLPGFLHAQPNDWELYIEGRVESAEPAKIHPSDAAWLKQNGLDHLLGPGAWDSYFEAPPSSQAEVSDRAVAEAAAEEPAEG